MPEYVFDVVMHAVVRVDAANRQLAGARVMSAIDCIGPIQTGDPNVRIGEMSVDKFETAEDLEEGLADENQLIDRALSALEAHGVEVIEVGFGDSQHGHLRITAHRRATPDGDVELVGWDDDYGDTVRAAAGPMFARLVERNSSGWRHHERVYHLTPAQVRAACLGERN